MSGNEVSKVVSIKVTTRCNAWCDLCGLREWMKANPYDMSMQEFERFIEASLVSGYRFDKVVLSGGEPLIWPSLEQGIYLLRKSGLTRGITLYTNALAVALLSRDILAAIVGAVDCVRVSLHEWNRQSYLTLKNQFGARVQCVERPFVVPPHVPMEGSLPADCTCKSLSVSRDAVHLCTGQEAVAARLPRQCGHASSSSAEIRPGYMKSLDFDRRHDRDVCKACLSNRKVAAVQPCRNPIRCKMSL